MVAGPLSLTAPGSATLGSTTPGGMAQGSLGQVQVIDDRGFGAGWTATASGTNFTTGGGSPVETIPVGDVTYAISGLNSTAAQAVVTHIVSAILSGNPEAVVTATSVTGNTAVSWNPVIQVTVPSGAIGGTYTATIVHSVA